MGTFRDTMASLLRNNPTIYPEPRDAMLFLMLSRGQWRDGQWEIEGIKPNDNPMDFSDLDDDKKVLFEGADTLQHEIKVHQRRVLDQNMDCILQDDPTRVYFRPAWIRDFRTQQLIEGLAPGQYLPAPDRPPFLDFPRDIAPDWGRAITHFHAFVEHELNNRYQLNPTIKDYDNPMIRAHWKVGPLMLFRDMNSARHRLHPLLNNGQSYETHREELNAISKRLIDEVIEEEKRPAKPARP